MTKKMLIDATHEEETRVAVVDGNRLLEFDYESKVRKQIKGNIFLAKVTRVEPSLQAAFVNFGGNRHGFLPFSEIHPDYYRLPVADRERLKAEQAEELSARRRREEEREEDEDEKDLQESSEAEAENDEEDFSEENSPEEVGGDNNSSEDDETEKAATENDTSDADEAADPSDEDQTKQENTKEEKAETSEKSSEEDSADASDSEEENEDGAGEKKNSKSRPRGRGRRGNYRGRKNMPSRNRAVEMVGGDDFDSDHPRRYNYRRHYKIQEVVKRGQIMLIQVSKEERGNKGAAVTTYLSLPGRYCVLMPNSPHAGGISRKIGNFKDRRYLKDILKDLDVPEGMSVILRTAGVSRTKSEIKRDLDYLLRLWNDIRELTLQSSAPALINEEGNLINRSIRDIYTRDIEDVIVAGNTSYKAAKKFMKLLIPSHARKVKEYKEERLPLFQRYQVESQINEIADPSVTLKSGGYLVINPTEALVSIDVNSGKATKERHIEETALKTNLEAADEIARQLRLRDLGGLVVIDFIDMEDRRNNIKVERRTKEALSSDRARIQVGRISSFGLLELSRQRMNPSLTESQFSRCPHCQGVGFVRTLDGTAIAALRSVEEVGTRARYAEVVLKVPSDVALYILNHKRAMLASIEERYGFTVNILTSNEVAYGKYEIEPGSVKQDEKTDKNTETESSDDKNNNKEDTNSDEKEASTKESKSGRKRGRRGGRRRNNRTDDSRKDDAQRNDQVSEENTENASSEEAEKSSEGKQEEKSEKRKPRRSTRRPVARRKKTDETVEEATVSDAKEQKEETSSKEKPSPAKEKKEKKAKPAPKKSRKKTEQDNEPSVPSSESSVSPVSPAKDVIETRPVAEHAPKSSVEYEVVSQPTEKKKGWWNKFGS